MKKLVGSVLLSAAFAASAFAAQKPKVDISARKHPNLAAAQMHAQMAFDKVSAAQAANEFDMGGHAAKAKDLLSQAMAELKAAAEAANQAK